MADIKKKHFQALQKTKQYLRSTIFTPIIFASFGFLFRILFVGRNLAMSELLSWVEWVLIPALLGLIIVYLWHFFNFGHKLRTLFKFIKLLLKININFKVCDEILKVYDSQKKNPEKWLYPVIERVDLNRQGISYSDNNIYTKFQIDSHLLFELKKYRLFVKLCLKPDIFSERETNWYELKQQLNPINKLERHDYIEEPITLDNEIILNLLKDFRNGKPLLAKVKIGIDFQENNNPIYLEHSPWIAPMNDYRGD